MTIFAKAAALTLLTLILGLFLGQQEKGMATLISIAACAMVASAALGYLEPVVQLLREMEAFAGVQDGILGILIQSVGVTIACEIVGAICKDAGFCALAQALHLLGTAAVLFLSSPVYRSFLKLIQEILQAI